VIKLVEKTISVPAGASVTSEVYSRSGSQKALIHYLSISLDANVASAFLILDGMKITPTLVSSQSFTLGKDKLFRELEVKHSLILSATGGTVAGKVNIIMYVDEV
jgi:hypothetical protein